MFFLNRSLTLSFPRPCTCACIWALAKCGFNITIIPILHTSSSPGAVWEYGRITMMYPTEVGPVVNYLGPGSQPDHEPLTPNSCAEIPASNSSSRQENTSKGTQKPQLKIFQMILTFTSTSYVTHLWLHRAVNTSGCDSKSHVICNSAPDNAQIYR